MTATTNAVKTASAATTARNAEREPVKFVKRIGSTSYVVSARFNVTATETAEDKILRLIEREVSSLC
ncbi:hypothetical protein FACS1894219_00250 [Clostridia bacterium]|jgi:hypothetical protein|nr:hypothetical protein FACS1894219_00250 [Clostridia bacterium]